MREGRIDLDWLDGNIEAYKKVLDEKKDSYSELDRTYNHLLNAFVEIRSKCTPIYEPFKFVDSSFIQVNGNVFLSKTCINEWESNQYCDKKDSCEMCQLK